MNEEREDPRLRPVVLQTSAPAPDGGRRSTRILTWAGGVGLAVAAAAGLVAGGTAVWSAVDPGSPAQSPAPLWIQPPPVVSGADSETTAPTPAHETSTPDDHGRHGSDDNTTAPTSTDSTSGPDDHGRDDRTTGPTSTRSSSGPDDHGGRRTTEPTATSSSSGSDNSRLDNSGSDNSGSDDSGSGNSGHN